MKTMKFCPQCGNALIQGDLFCEKCGLRIEKDQPTTIDNQPKDVQQETHVFPLYQPNEYENQQSGFENYIPGDTSHLDPPQRKPLKLVPILIIVGIVVVLGLGGWLVYANFIKAKSEVTVTDSTALVTDSQVKQALDSTSNTTVPQTSPDSVAPTTSNTVKTTPQPAEKSTTPTKATVKVDKGTISKTKTPIKNTSYVQETTKPTKQVDNYSNQPTAPVVEPKNVASKSVMIFQIGQFGFSILKNPKKDCSFTLNDKYCITRITTDHYNGGKGTETVGTIGIEGINGNSSKHWHAMGEPGPKHAPNAKWIIEPNIILSAGKYTVVDSERETWAKNIIGKGFVTVEGYKVQ